MTKRLFDILAAFTGLLILSPVIILTCILIKVTMPGPVFFIQNRVGRNRKEFKMIKFRTMSVKHGTDKDQFDAGNTSRITRLGKFLRKTKLDEIPQLINVLKGDMSIVGPRPEVKSWTKVYPEKWAIVHTVKPGITDNASILFRNEEEILAESPSPESTYSNEILPQKLDLYIDYVHNHSLWRDIIIIFRTIKEILLK